jgi:SAM-dependent methyltransferase
MNRDEFGAYIEREDVSEAELPEWFATVRDTLESGYLERETPWGQSGKSGGYEEWVRVRIPFAETIERDGHVLDIGCANGFLLECLLEWTRHKAVSIIPHGLDMGERLVRLARARLPVFASNIHHGNAWDWSPPRQYDVVRSELVYVPAPFRRAYVARLLEHVVAPGGRLVVAHYRGRTEDLSVGWHDALLREWGYAVAQVTRGFGGSGLEKARFMVIEK